MNIVLAVLAFLTALLPLANQGVLQYQEYKRQQQATQPARQVQTALRPILPPMPPEIGQPNVVFRNGEWWKFEEGRWLVWRQNVQLAQGGENVFR